MQNVCKIQNGNALLVFVRRFGKKSATWQCYSTMPAYPEDYCQCGICQRLMPANSLKSTSSHTSQQSGSLSRRWSGMGGVTLLQIVRFWDFYGGRRGLPMFLVNMPWRRAWNAWRKTWGSQGRGRRSRWLWFIRVWLTRIWKRHCKFSQSELHLLFVCCQSWFKKSY